MPPDGCLWHAFGMAHQPPAPLVLPDGRPLHVAAEDFRDGEGLALPPVFSFAAVIGGASKTYYHDRFDEAMRHSRENALAMRRDAFLMSLLQERKMAVSSLPWYLETPDPKDRLQAKVRGVLTQCLRGTRGLRRMILSWLEAIWYGRYGNQFSWRWQEVEGRRTLSVDRWAPINGDKIGYHWDGTPYVLVNAAKAANLPGVVLTNTTRARALSLLGGWRDRFVIHQHEIDDADYFEAEAGDGRHGVGVRSRVYWLDFLKREYLDWVVTYLERVGLGTTLWKYDASSPEQKAKAEEAARDNSRRVNITVPVWPDRAGGYSGGVERIEAPMGGVEALRTMIEAMDQYIERYIIGQAGSSQSQSSGLGNEAASEFMSSTKDAIRDHDAHLLAETITGSDQDPGLLSLMQRYSFPETTADRPNGFPVLFKFGLEKSLNNQRVQTITQVSGMGLPVRKDDIYNAAGLSRPEPHDDVLEPQQQGGPGGAGGNPLAAMMGGGGGPPGGDVPPDGGGGEDAPASEEDVDAFLSELFGDDAEDAAGGEPEEDRASEEDVDGFLAELLGGGEEDDQPRQMARQGRGVEQHHSRLNPVLPAPRRPLRYGWEMTRDLGDGRKRWKGTEEHKGQYRTQRIKPGTRVKASGDNRRSIGEHIDTLLESPEQFTPEHRDDLRSKLLTLTRDQFAALRSQFGIRKQGRRKEDEINTLLEGVEERKGPDPRAGRNREGLGGAKVPERKTVDFSGARWAPLGNAHGNMEMLQTKVGGRSYVAKAMQRKNGVEAEIRGGDLARKLGLNVPRGQPISEPPDGQIEGDWKGWKFPAKWIAMGKAEGRVAREEDAADPGVRRALLRDLLVGFALGNDDRNDANILLADDGTITSLDWEPSFSDSVDPERYWGNSIVPDDGSIPLDKAVIAKILQHRQEIIRVASTVLGDEMFLDDTSNEGKTLESYAIARLDMLEQLAAMESPTLGDFRRLQPPQEGDTNAEGLVFRDGRWRREEDPRPQRNRQGLGQAKPPEKRKESLTSGEGERKVSLTPQPGTTPAGGQGEKKMAKVTENPKTPEEWEAYNRRPVSPGQKGLSGRLAISGETKAIKDRLKAKNWKYNPANSSWYMDLPPAVADVIRNGGQERIDFLSGVDGVAPGIRVSLNGVGVFVDAEHPARASQRQPAAQQVIARVRRTSGKAGAPVVGQFLRNKDGSYVVVTGVSRPVYLEEDDQWEHSYETRDATPEESKQATRQSKIAELKKELSFYEGPLDDDRNAERHAAKAAELRRELAELEKE